MKRSRKAQPFATPAGGPPAPGRSSGASGSPGAADPAVSGRAEGSADADRPGFVESVAGEEDPGSALEQFSDLMQGSPGQGGPAAEAAKPQSSHAASPTGSSLADGQTSSPLKKAPDRPD